MNPDSIILKISSNPIYCLFQESKNSISFKIGKKRIGTYSDFLSAIEARDMFFKQKYGNVLYAEIQEIYHNGIGDLKKIKKAGPFYINKAGEIFGKNFKKLKESRRNRFYVTLNNKIKVNLTKLDIVNLSNGKTLCSFDKNRLPIFYKIIGDELVRIDKSDRFIFIEGTNEDFGLCKSRNRNNYYWRAEIYHSGKKYLNSFKDKQSASTWFFDKYKELKGIQHPADKRRLNNEI